MTNLKESLNSLLVQFSVEYSLSERASGGCNVVFYNVLSTAILRKLVVLIAFCDLNGYSYCITANRLDVEFQIYR